MKKIFFIMMTALAFTATAQKGPVKTATFTVSGNCGECKERIENAADIKGVKLLTWSEKTKVATVKYDTTMVKLEGIQKAIAAHGHDAGPYKADDKSYNKLPDCCRYRTGDCEKPKGH